MWISTPNSALSIVSKDCGPDELLVRARIRGDIEATLPDAVMSEDAASDYRFRARLPREEVALHIADQVRGFTYQNFKAEVHEDGRHSAYMKLWRVMFRFQQEVAQRERPRRK